MACPFFMPVARADQGAWIHAPRLPLGDRYRGVCRANPHESAEVHGDPCNCGYARGACDRFPAEEKIDAVRFSVAQDDEKGLKLIYILERGHSPVEHGILDYPSEFPGEGELLAAQARAFAESHLRRRG